MTSDHQRGPHDDHYWNRVHATVEAAVRRYPKDSLTYGTLVLLHGCTSQITAFRAARWRNVETVALEDSALLLVRFATALLVETNQRVYSAN